MSKDSTKQILRELKKLRKELGGRLDHLESRIDDISGSSTGTSQRFDTPPISQGLKSNGATSRQSFTGPTERDVTVKIQPLTDLGMARVVESALADTEGVENAPSVNELKDIFFNLESGIVRSRILNGEPRIDGRDTRTVRPIEIRTGVLPRTHGSALFTRGETQALVVATLGTGRDEQIIDAIAGEYRELSSPKPSIRNWMMTIPAKIE